MPSRGGQRIFPGIGPASRPQAAFGLPSASSGASGHRNDPERFCELIRVRQSKITRKGGKDTPDCRCSVRLPFFYISSRPRTKRSLGRDPAGASCSWGQISGGSHIVPGSRRRRTERRPRRPPLPISGDRIGFPRHRRMRPTERESPPTCPHCLPTARSSR